jgi:hypothetical protein
MMRLLALWHCLKMFCDRPMGKGQQRDVQQQDRDHRGRCCQQSISTFTLLSSLAPRAGLVTWRQTFVHCSQQTAAAMNSRRFMSSMGDFLPYAY